MNRRQKTSVEVVEEVMSEKPIKILGEDPKAGKFDERAVIFGKVNPRR